MIWSRGEILPDDGLGIPATDRTFEHGLGLFETLRTWGGRATLLPRHRSRMLASAEALGLEIDPAHFPDEGAVDRLLLADGAESDRMLRITATGGPPGGRSLVWMRATPIPALVASSGLAILLGGWSSTEDDPMARHKSLNYWSRRMAHESARARGFHEALGRLDDGTFGEGSRSNLFLIRGDVLMTPSLGLPIVPGVMRGLVLERAGEVGLDARESGGLAPEEIEAADSVFLTNAVRGIMRVGRGLEHATGRWLDLKGRDGGIARLERRIADHLDPTGDRP